MWKVTAFVVLSVIPGALLAVLFFVPWGLAIQPRLLAQLLLTGLWMLGVVIFLGLLRCPNCRRSIGRWALSNKEGFVRLFRLQACPYCSAR